MHLLIKSNLDLFFFIILIMIYTVVLIISISFLITFYIIPLAIKFSNKYGIYDLPNHIKNHHRKISFLGGTAIILGTMIPLELFIPNTVSKPIYLNALIIILRLSYLQGLDDDIFNRSAIRKFIIQLILCSLLIYYSDLRLPMGSLFSQIAHPYFIFIMTVVFAVAIVNSYNLIDGIDGLAASISLLSCLFFAFVFYLESNYFFFFMALSLTAALIAFLCYNKPPAHIFMGDSGSLFIGMVLATFTLVFINARSVSLPFTYGNRFIISFSFISIPFLDMIRLFGFRIYKKSSPFKGDNNHIHHLMTKIGFTNKQTVFIIISLMLLNVGIAFLAIDNSFLGFIPINIAIYVLLIQGLRQLNTFLSKRGFNISGERISESNSNEQRWTA